MYTLEDDSHTPNNNYTATTATGTANNQSHNNEVYNQNGLVWEWAQPQSSMVAEEDHTPNLLLMHENGLVNLPQPHTTNLSCTPNSFLNSDHISLNPNWGLQAFEQARFARSTPFGSATLFSAVSGLSNNNTTNQSYLVGYGGQPDLGLMANHMISAPNSTAMTETEESRVFNDYMKCGLNVGDFNSRLGLNLGGRMYFDDILAPLLSFGKRPRPNSVTLTQPPLCQVEGCKGDLTLAKHYHRRHKVCDFHSKSPTVVVSGTTQRFCQQCSRFHSLTEFDEGKRSCRKRLADHNRRRRKPQPNSSSNPTPANSKDALTNEEVKRVKPAGLALTQSEVHASSSNIVALADPDTALDSKEQLSLSLDKKIKEQKMVQYSASKPPNLSLSTSLPSPPLGQPLGGLHLDPSVDPWQIQSTPNCNGLLLFTPDHVAQQRENLTLHNASNITTTTSTTATTTTTNNNNMAFSALPTADSPCDDHLTKNYCSSTSDWSTIKGFTGHLNDEFDSPQLSLQGSSEMRHHVLSLLEERQVEQKASTIISLDQHHHSHNHHHLLPPQQHLAEQQASGHDNDNDNHLFFPTNNTTSVNNQPDHFKNLGLQAWRPFNKLIYNAANDDRI